MQKLTQSETDVLGIIVSYLDPEFNPGGYTTAFSAFDLVTYSKCSEPFIQKNLASMVKKKWLKELPNKYYLLTFGL